MGGRRERRDLRAAPSLGAPRAGRPGEPRATGAPRGPPRRPPRAGPRRRRGRASPRRHPTCGSRMPAPTCSRYVVEKGSITVDGVSPHRRRRRSTTGSPSPSSRTPPRSPRWAARPRGRPGQPRGRRDGQVRRATARRLSGTGAGHATPRRTRSMTLVSRWSAQGPTESAFATIDDAVAADRPGRDRGRGRRRGPRERGRPDHGGRGRHAREDRLLRAPHLRASSARPLTGERLDELDIPLMVRDNTESQRTAFTYSSTTCHGTSTGISAADRAATIQALIDPGHTPRRPRPARATSSRCATPRAACSSGPATPRPRSTSPAWPGCTPPACSARSSTTTAPWPGSRTSMEFCEEHGLLMISIAELIRTAARTRSWSAGSPRPASPPAGATSPATSTSRVLDGEQHVAMVRGAVQGEDDVLVRVHSECLTGDVFGSLRCDCGVQLDAGDGEDRRRGPRRARLPAGPRGSRHRPRPQDPGLQPAGGGPRHRRGQRGARPAGRQPRVRHRRADPRRPRHHHDAAA